MSFFSDLLDRFQLFEAEEAEEPQGEAQEDEVSVGVLSDELKRLYAVRCEAQRALREFMSRTYRFMADHMFEQEPPAELDQLAQEEVTLRLHHKGVDDLFWTAVRCDFPETAQKSQIGIRAGWEVVYKKTPEGKTLTAILSRLLDPKQGE